MVGGDSDSRIPRMKGGPIMTFEHICLFIATIASAIMAVKAIVDMIKDKRK